MSTSSYHYETITARCTSPGVVTLTHGRLDRASGRLVFTHLADVMGDMEGALDAAEVLSLGSSVLLSRCQEERTAYLAPAGG